MASEQKKKNSTSTNTKKTNTPNKKYTNRPLVVLVIVCIIAVGVMYWLKNTGTKEVTKTSSSGVSDSTTTQEEEEQSREGELIDMENTTNAKIEDGNKINTSEELHADKTFKGMNIKDIKLQTEDYISNFTATVENNSGADYEGGTITIVFTNQDGSEYVRLNSLLPPIKNGETNEITASSTADIINAYNFSIE